MLLLFCAVTAGKLLGEPTYQSRWVEGVEFLIGTEGEIQAWVAFTSGRDPSALVYLVNGGETPSTFFPTSISAVAARKTRYGVDRKTVRTLGPGEYEGKLLNRDAWAAFAYGLSAAAANRPQPQTSSFGVTVTAVPPGFTLQRTYNGTLTTWPTSAEYARALQTGGVI
jgi:hypothetical protein